MKICPHCGTSFEDSVTTCPSCGFEINGVPERNDIENRSFDDDSSIPNFNEKPQKVEISSVKIKVEKSTKKRVLLVVTLVAALLISIFCGYIVYKNQQAKVTEAEYADLLEKYEKDIEHASSLMLVGAVEAEQAGNLIVKVWSNAIHEDIDSATDQYTRPHGYFVDFNTALQNLFSDSSFQSKISSIENNQDNITKLMKELRNPPLEYEDAYDALRDYYEAYLSLTGLVTNPTGSLQTFSSSFHDAVSAVSKSYDAMDIYLD